MKLVATKPILTNTEKSVLRLVARGCDYGVTCLQIVNVLWPQSAQPLKKCKTIERTLRRLMDMDLATCVGGSSAYRFTEVRWKTPKETP